MTAQTLVLTPWMMPHTIVSWQDAVTMTFLGKVDVLEEYEEVLRSPSVAMKTPAVVRLKRAIGGMKRGIRFSRLNVFTRDGFRCQYCGAKCEVNGLNYDHVIPRVQGGHTAWENIVSSCYACNSRKRGRTPEQAGMKLLRAPTKPKWLPATPVIPRSSGGVPLAWSPYCVSP